MKYFWQGFSKTGAGPARFKRHVIVLYWSPESGADPRPTVNRVSIRHPSVKVKVVNTRKEPTKATRHKVNKFPTVLLLKDGREVDRLEGEDGNTTLLDQLFRKAHV